MRNFYLFCICLFLVTACSKPLDEVPQGVISDEDLNTPENIEKMVTAAYAALGNESIRTSNSLWPWGSLRSGDAYKGGDGLGDNSEWNDYETFVTNRPDNGYTDEMWQQLYIGIGRVNDALKRVNEIGEDLFPQKTARQAELRFIRGHFYFLLKILWKYVPFVDENVPRTEYASIFNRELSNSELWDRIAEDFRFAADNLPATQTDAGRPTGFAAKAYLAKVLLYQAYVQDEEHNVVSIDQAKLEEVVSLCDEIEGHADLFDDFGKNFLTEYENGTEALFSVQYSLNDGMEFGRIDMGHALSFTMNPEFGCCGFHVPSQNMINAFKTNDQGLPMFEDYDLVDAKEGNDFQQQHFDPRLDHSIAIPGHPFKYDPDVIFARSWARSPNIYGAYASLKDLVPVGDPSFKKIPPFMSSAKNWEVIRYADVLLWKAEALIELGRQHDALPLINRIRTRAKNSTTMLKTKDGSLVSSYSIETYQPGFNCNWTQGYARQALRWERRLELAMEGNRFFDLVRWGIADEYLNAYFSTESKKKSYLATAHFQKGRDEYLPIPLNQVNLSKGLYQQNNGW